MTHTHTSPAPTPSDAAVPPVLLTGAGGQVGQAIAAGLSRFGPVVAATRAMVDLESPESIVRVMRDLRPGLVVNAAAYTAVDLAESDQARCHRVNVVAPRVIAEEAARLGAPLVHYSTNYVFDGALGRPYGEDDAPSPLGEYGRSKLLGERAVADVDGRHLVIRTSGVYGWHGTNFLRRMLELAHERAELRVVSDQLVSPTPAWLVADATCRMLGEALSRSATEALWGTFHVTSTGATTWFDFAAALVALDPDRDRQRCRSLVPIPTSDYPTPARRPLNGVLDTQRARYAFGIVLPSWDEALRRTFAERPSHGAAAS